MSMFVGKGRYKRPGVVLCLLSSFFMLWPLVSGCSPWIKVGDIATFQLRVNGRSDNKILVPGKAVKLDVVLIDRKGKSHSLAQKQLPAKHVKITVSSNAKYNPQTRMLTPLKPEETDEISENSVNNYKVTVLYFNRKEVFTYKPDIAAVFGPEPKNVKSMKVTIVAEKGKKPPYYNNMQGILFAKPKAPLLTPGKKIYLFIEVSDGKRTYKYHSLKPSYDFDLSVKRLSFQTQNMRWDSESESVIPSKAPSVKGKLYKLTIVYKGAKNIQQKFTFTPDFAMLKGPDPKLAKAFKVSLGTDPKSSLTKILPGKAVPLSIRVQDKYGRWFYNSTKGRKVPAYAKDRVFPGSLVKIESETLKYDPSKGVLQSSLAKASEMVDKKYEFTASYKDREEFKSEQSLEPDFLGLVAPHISTQEKILLKSPKGIKGGDGGRGANGADGQDTNDPSRRAEAGKPGEPGGTAIPGAPGEPGPSVRLNAGVVQSLDGKKKYILIQLKIEDKGTKYILRPYDAKPLRIVTQGGDGGDGGIGGPGGKGGSGGNGWRSGHGGNGGNGGESGNAGAGGNGGSIQAFLSSSALKRKFKFQSIAGKAGRAGQAGRPGAAGLPGKVVGDGGKTGVSSRGNDGKKGAPGKAGKPAKDGKRGRIRVRIQSDVLTKFSRKIPAVLKKILKPANGDW